MLTAFIWQVDRFIARILKYPLKFLCRLLNINNRTVAKLCVALHVVSFLVISVINGNAEDVLAFAVYFLLYVGPVIIFIGAYEGMLQELEEQFGDSAVIPVNVQIYTLGKFFRSLMFLIYLFDVVSSIDIWWGTSWWIVLLLAIYLALPASMYFVTNTTPKRPSRTKILIRKTRKLLEEVRHWRPAPAPVPRPFGV